MSSARSGRPVRVVERKSKSPGRSREVGSQTAAPSQGETVQAWSAASW